MSWWQVGCRRLYKPGCAIWTRVYEATKGFQRHTRTLESLHYEDNVLIPNGISKYKNTVVQA
jgi:hypothetical protein